LDTVDLGVIDTREILQLIVNAVRLSFWTSSRQGPIMLPIPAFKLPIEQLVWRGLLVRDASIFAPLILPNLTSLELQDASDDSLRLLRERAPFELQELKLFFTQLTFAATAKFLRGMQSMTILELRLSIALTDELMVFLTYDARAPILPALKDLTLSDCRKYFDECTMLRMVESRWPSGGRGPRFRQVSITTRPLSLNRVRESRAIVPSGLAVVPLSTPNVRRGIMDRIAEMKEEGLSFSYEIVV
jgi:hypothetical protein